MDKTGLCVGIGCGQWVIVPTGQEQGRFKNLIGSHGDTEHVSIVEAISAGGTVIALLIIIKGAIIQARWFADIQDNDICWIRSVANGGIIITIVTIVSQGSLV